MFFKKKKPPVDEEFEVVFGETITSFCKNDDFKATLLRNGILSNTDDQIDHVLKQLNKNDAKTRQNINEVIHNLS